jgi:hypothetical protein
MMLRNWPRFTIAVVLFALSAAAPAAAQSRVQVGVLDCRGAGGVSFVVGSVNNLGCEFRPNGGYPQRYVATIRRYGVDLGISGNSVLTWLVFAPSRDVGYGVLSGTYVGASAGAAVGVGVTANALVGGSDNSFNLQPLSVAGGTGLNVAAGVAGLELRPAFLPPHHHHRHHHHHG